MNAESQSVPVKKGRWLRIVLLLFLLFGILLFSGIFAAAAAAFSDHKKIPPAQLSREDLILQQKLLQRLSREVLRRKPKRESTLVLKTSELHSLFRLVDYGFSIAKLAGKYDGLEPRYLEVEFENGRIRAIYPQDTGLRWLFGGVLRWQITATPDFDNKILAVDIHECRIGSIPLPAQTAEHILQKLLARLYRSPDYALFCSMVRKIQMKTDGSLVVIYHPAKLLPLLMF